MLQASKCLQSMEQCGLSCKQPLPVCAAQDQKLATVLGMSVEKSNTHQENQVIHLQFHRPNTFLVVVIKQVTFKAIEEQFFGFGID